MQISGLLINGSRVSLLALKEKGSSFSVASYAVQELEEGIIENGELIKPEALENALKLLENKAKPRVGPYVTVALPEELVYLTEETLPNIESNQVREALELNLNSFLPGDPAEVFWNFKTFEGSGDLNVVLASIKKESMNKYLQVLAKVGFIPVAVEPASLAARRSFQNVGKSLLIEIDNKSVLVTAFLGEKVNFGSSFNFDKENIVGKIRKIVDFIKVRENLNKISILLGGDFTPELKGRLAVALDEEIIKAGEKLIIQDNMINSPSLLGLALRGKTQSKEGNNFSFLPTNNNYQAKSLSLYLVVILLVIILIATLFFITRLLTY